MGVYMSKVCCSILGDIWYLSLCGCVMFSYLCVYLTEVCGLLTVHVYMCMCVLVVYRYVYMFCIMYVEGEEKEMYVVIGD